MTLDEEEIPGEESPRAVTVIRQIKGYDTPGKSFNENQGFYSNYKYENMNIDNR